jgi:protein phosphatase-4 regulatory subunit 3
MISLMEEESKRDNMLSSACMDILEIIRKVSLVLSALAK